MPNLGSSDTPVEGQSFGLPAGAELGEDNGELVIKDSSGTIILRRNETASEWQFEGTDLSGINAIDASSATLDGGIIGGLAFGRGVGQDTVGSLTEVNGSKVSVSANSFEPMIDKASAVGVIGGFVMGTGATVLRATWDDGSTDTIYSNAFAQGTNGGGSVFTTINVPSLESVTKVEFKNDLNSSSDFGYKILHS